MGSPDSDQLRRFIFDGTSVHGEIVRLDRVMQDALEHHDYGRPVAALVGEALAAAALLGSRVKFADEDGSLTLQIQDGSPIELLVTRFGAQRELRGLARWSGSGEDLGDEPFGEGHLGITIDPGGDGERYQGVVTVAGSMSSAIEGYFARSEQIRTRIWLASDGVQAAGLMLQQLPGEEGDDPDAWERTTLLADSVTPEELLALSDLESLHRLFHAEATRIFAPEALHFGCTCNRTRIEGLIRALGREDTDAVLVEQGQIGITCEFCGRNWTFDSIDVESAFSGAVSPATDSKH